MKKILYIALTAALALSCEKAAFLERAPFSSTSPENFYKNEAQMKLALVSCYETVTTHKIPGLSFCQAGSYSQGLLYIMNGPSDDIISNATAQGEGIEMENGIFDESSAAIRNFWKTFYTGINRCNTVLDYIDGVEGLAEETKVQYRAEARFMRAFFYYHLAWNFGGVPVITRSITDGQESRDNLETVYSLIFEDLDFAVENLPESGGIIPGMSANKYAAAAYIGRICNYLAACKRYGTGEDFVEEQPLNSFGWVDADAMTGKALENLKFVVENSPYVLNDDFRLNFVELSKAAQARECLFVADQPIAGVEGYWPASYYIPTPAMATTSDIPGSFGGRHVPTQKAFYMYDKRDARRDWNITGRYSDGYREIMVDGHRYATPTFQDSTKAGVPYPYYDGPSMSYSPASSYKCCTGKFRLAHVSEVAHTFKQSAMAYPLMRLADVYLMYAEAIWFDNRANEDEARVWMDKVLERSATDESNFLALKEAYHNDDFLEELLESRDRELFMECSRKFDLIRFNRIDKAIEGINISSFKDVYRGSGLEEKYYEVNEVISGLYKTLKDSWFSYKIWLPISEEQRGVNKNLSQNAGW